VPSFDVVSKIELHEIDNAINSTSREVSSRYDFKGSNCTIERKEQEVTILAADDYKLKSIQEMFKVHSSKRGVDVKAFDFQTPQKASGNSLRQIVKLKQGIESETGKKIVKELKSNKFKVQASIRGDELRVEGKDKDILQEVIMFIKGMNLDLPVQFTNFRD
jgi:uncharacterized protein YajQ (UPF0234 family)